MKILAIETIGQAGGIALLEEGAVVLETLLPGDQRSAKTLAPAIREILDRAQWQSTDVQLVAAAIGPGSFTGLRVGVTTAKTFAYAVRAEVVGVHTLEVIAAQAPSDIDRLSVVLDAQRQQVFAGEFARGGHGAFKWIGSTAIFDNDAWLSGLDASTAVSGPGLEKLAPRLPATITAVPPKFWAPHAATVGQLGWRYYQAGQRDDLWRLVPQYFRRSAAEEKWEQSNPAK